MQKVGLFQIIYTKYKTDTNKEKTKKQFIFLEEFIYNNSIECIELYREVSKRYKQYNNIITLEYDKQYKGYLFHKSRNVTLLLDTKKGILQDGFKIDYFGSW